jgi:hypothetical protein
MNATDGFVLVEQPPTQDTRYVVHIEMILSAPQGAGTMWEGLGGAFGI